MIGLARVPAQQRAAGEGRRVRLSPEEAALYGRDAEEFERHLKAAYGYLGNAAAELEELRKLFYGKPRAEWAR